MRNICIRKGLVVGIIVLFIGIAFAPCFNAISISKEKAEYEESTGWFNLEVLSIDIAFYGSPGAPLEFVKVTLESKDGTIKRSTRTGLFGRGGFFCLPENKEYIVHGFKRNYKEYDIDWVSKYSVHVIMIYTGKPKTLDNPFFNHFPMLEQLLTYRGDIL